MRINRIGNWAKTTVLAGLLATSPIAAKAQALNKGETVLARDTVELFNSRKAQALLIDTDGNFNNFEKFALNTVRSATSGHAKLQGKKGTRVIEETQYVDTLIRVFKKIEGESSEKLEYYLAGPWIKKGIVVENETGKVVANEASKTDMNAVRQRENLRMEIPKALYDEIDSFLKHVAKKDEHVIEKRRVEFDPDDWD